MRGDALSSVSASEVDALNSAENGGAGDGSGNPLKRTLTTWDLTGIGIGGIVGAGVFVLTGQAAALYAGPAVVVSFLVAGLGCFFCALCYAELSSTMPVAGSAYSFTTATLGQLPGWVIGWVGRAGGIQWRRGAPMATIYTC